MPSYCVVMCLKHAVQRQNLHHSDFMHSFLSCGRLNFTLTCFTAFLCQVRHTHTHLHRNKHTKAARHAACPSDLQLDTVRWLILPHFPSGPIWDTICLALIMTQPSPISLSLWDITWPLWVFRVCLSLSYKWVSCSPISLKEFRNFRDQDRNITRF